MKLVLHGLFSLLCLVLPGLVYAQSPPIVLVPNTPNVTTHNVYISTSGDEIVWPEKAKGVRGAIFADYKKYNGDVEAGFYKHSPVSGERENTVYERVAAGIRVRKVFMRATFIHMYDSSSSSRKTAYGVGFGPQIRFSVRDLASVEFETSGFSHVFTNSGHKVGSLTRTNFKIHLVRRLFFEAGMSAFTTFSRNHTKGSSTNDMIAYGGFAYRFY